MSYIGEVVGSGRDWVVGHREPDLPRVRPTPSLAAKWMIDEWSLQMEFAQSRLRMPTIDFRRRLRDELGDAVEMFNARGWVDDPRSYHVDPPPMEGLTLTKRRAGFQPFEHLTVPSEYEPHADEPGRERWLGYEANRTAHAWLLRHEGPPRPWLVCINGYRTGQTLVDFNAFDARRLHHKYGLNLAFPVQPLHGPRSEGPSGSRVLHSGAMNTVHTAAQALWDIRRLVGWLRQDQEAPAVGAMGLSLGGYLTALLGCFDDELACVIAGIPEADLVRGQRRTVERMLPPFYEQWGLSWRSLERINRVVSPLAMDCLVPHDRRFIFAGLVDRWVRPGNVQTLWRHWDEPEICWYPGSHLSFMVERSVRSFIGTAVERTLSVT